jgi:hypothetical protein
VSSSPLLGLIERQMTDLDEHTDQLHDAPDDEPAS